MELVSMVGAVAKSTRFKSGFLGLTLLLVGWSFVGASGLASETTPPMTIWEEPAEPLVPRFARTEADEDRLHAAAHFAQGRLWLQRGRSEWALRHYQRAWRYCPARVEWLTEIVQLAGQQELYAEAVRYALLAAERNPESPQFATHLAAILSEQGQTERALRLLERASQRHGPEPPDFDYLAMQVELGRLAHLLSQDQPAAAALLPVFHALNEPTSGLSEEERSQLLSHAELLYQLMGACFLRVGKIAEARAAYRLAQAAQPNRPLWELHQAEIAVAEGQLDVAFDLLQSCLESASSSLGEKPYQLLEQILLRQLSDAAAAQQRLLRELQRLRAEQPTNRPLALFLAAQLRRHGEASQALGMYEQLFIEQPSLEVLQGWFDTGFETGQPEPMRVALASMLELAGTLEGMDAQLARLIQHPARLRQLFANAQRLLPQPVDAAGSPDTANSARKPGQNDDGASASAKPSLTKSSTVPATADPSRANAEDAELSSSWKPSRSAQLAVASIVALEAEQFALAEILMQGTLTVADQPSDLTVLHALAKRWLTSRQPDRAVPLLERVIEREREPKRRFVLWLQLATAQARAGRTADALAAVNFASQLQPQSPRWLARQAWIHYHDRNLTAAETVYRQLLQQFDGPESKAAEDRPADAAENDEDVRDLVREAKTMLANLYVATQRPKAAESCLEEVLDEFPEDPGANNDLGYLWVDQRRHLERALNMIELAVKAEPDNPAYRDSLGWAHYQLGRYPQAVEQLEVACEREPNDGVLLDHLGDAYWKNGQQDQARAAWTRAAQRFGETGAVERQAATQKKLIDSPSQSNSM
jgi:tetratricopeptide (TPR) repeat protein